MIRTLRAWAAVPAALLMCGCYRYIPVEMNAIPVGPELRVFVSRRGLADIPEGIPTSQNYLSGRLVRVTTDSLLIQVPVSRTVDAPGAMDLRQNVFVPTAEVVDVQRRELHRSKTTMALVGGAGLAVALLTVVVNAGGNSDPQTGDIPDQIRVPLLTLPTP